MSLLYNGKFENEQNKLELVGGREGLFSGRDLIGGRTTHVAASQFELWWCAQGNDNTGEIWVLGDVSWNLGNKIKVRG